MIVWESLMCTDELWDLEHTVGSAGSKELVAHPGFVSLCEEHSKVMSVLTLCRGEGAAGEGKNCFDCWKSRREWLSVVALLWARRWTVKLVSSQQGFCPLQRW